MITNNHNTMNQCSFFLSFLLVCTLLKGYSKPLGNVKVISKDSTVLAIHASYENPIKFYYNDIYLERPILHEISSDTSFILYTDYPVLIVVTDSTPNRVTSYRKFHGRFTVNNFLVYPSERIKVWKGTDGITRMMSDNDIRTNELNFFVDMEKELGLFEGFGSDLIPIKFSALEELDFVNSRFNKRIDFLNKYQKSNALSAKFINQVQKAFQTKRLERLISPYYSFYSGVFKKRDNLIDNTLEEWIKLNEEEYFYHPEYRGTIQQYLHYWALNNHKQTDISTLIILANQLLKGNVKEIALYDLIRYAAITGQDKVAIVTAFTDYLKYASDGFLKEYVIKSFQPQILAKRLGIGNDIMYSELVSDRDVKYHSWVELLSTDENKFIYLDFWASWCAPCRTEMPNSKKLLEEYSSKGVKFIYISIDDNVSSWKKAIAELGLSNSTNYLLPEGKMSPFSEKFKINTIPRYMLVGKDGQIINDNAPRPSDPKIRQLLDEVLRK